jgi:hypothetical protein
MRKRQKIILIIYVYIVITLGFLYVPYVRYYPGGTKQFVGHHWRFGLMQLLPWEQRAWGYTTIDAALIIAELAAVSAVFLVIFLLLRRE